MSVRVHTVAAKTPRSRPAVRRGSAPPPWAAGQRQASWTTAHAASSAAWTTDRVVRARQARHANSGASALATGAREAGEEQHARRRQPPLRASTGSSSSSAAATHQPGLAVDRVQPDLVGERAEEHDRDANMRRTCRPRTARGSRRSRRPAGAARRATRAPSPAAPARAARRRRAPARAASVVARLA